MSITEASTKTLIIPALERDFREGALYDARNEQMVLGFSLWNPDDLNKIEVRRNDGTHYLMNASDTLSEKLNGFDMNASVKLSILSGLIEPGGSVAYLKKEKNTRGECSVEVKCFFKTGYKEMDMNQLRNIRYLDVAKTGHNNVATHFVTKIQYGAGAIFTFTKQFQSGEEEEQVEAKAELNICGKKILSALNGSSERNHLSSWSTSRIQCEFKSFGLSLGVDLPTTFDKALEFAGSFARTAKKSFAKHRGEALGIPCTVWLYPLVLLPGCADAPKLHCDFNSEQAIEWIKFLEDCEKIENKLDLDLDRYSFKNLPIEIIKIHSIEWNKFLEDCKKIKNKLDLDPYSFKNLTRFQSLWKEKCRRKTELVTQLRSDSTAELREMIVKIRSGLIPIDCFNNKMSSIELHLGSVTQWRKEESETLEIYRRFQLVFMYE